MGQDFLFSLAASHALRGWWSIAPCSGSKWLPLAAGVADPSPEVIPRATGCTSVWSRACLSVRQYGPEPVSLYPCISEKSEEGGVTAQNVSHSTKENWAQGACCSRCGFSPWCTEGLDWGALAQSLRRRGQSCCWRSVSHWCRPCSQKFVVQILILSGKRIRDIFLGCLFSHLYTHPAAESRGKEGDGKFLGCLFEAGMC